MENIKITLAEVSNTASRLRILNQNLDDTLEYVYRTMQELSSVWLSEGATTIEERFLKFALRFKTESETLEAYAKFLDYTVASYDSLESTIVANAENFA